ncbi:MAG: WD40 repeat domain-containing serine/threonine-protein kinase, partial [Verrucomicrobia bacterium]|nr:WD40 repeat domain-containing serine/threonine-protein kinase [Verrucomicrobiota bacterium]
MDLTAPSNREKKILEQALALASSAERLAFVKGSCGADAALCARVLALLAAHETSGGFLVDKPEVATVVLPVTEKPGDRIGRYKLREKIGEGGCGLVYVAEQEEPVRRRVALKVIKLGMDTREVVARFEAERQALALMDHPNIAKVLDAGATETGRPYFVMELVRGIRITDYCDQNQLSTQERLALLIQVCHAIQHAHQKGIIHRDIKPSNVLVTLHDGVPVPKVIDFGIAKAMEQKLTDKTVYTAFEQFIGTPAYTSPEQAEMSGLDIDTRSDIYALGVMLYELLTGKTPFDGKELVAAGLEEMRRTIREREPVRPSTRLRTMVNGDLSTTAQRRRTEAPRLIHLLRGDLDWIVMKCLEKDRTRRYETANGLAQDIERHLQHEPVVARPPSTTYRVQKFVRRNKVMVAAGSAVAVALLLGIVGSTWQAVRATHARRDEATARARADEAARVARNAEIVARVAETNALRRAYVASLLSACDALEHEQIAAARRSLDNAPANLRGWEYWHLSSRLDLSLRIHERPGSDHTQVHVLPDGRSYYDVCADPTNCIRRWDLDTGQLLAMIPMSHPCRRSWLVAGGKQLVALIVEKDRPKAVEVWDLEGRTRLSSQPVPAWVQVAPSGSQVAYEWQGRVYLMDTKSGTTRAASSAIINVAAALTFQECGSPPLCFQPDGRRLAVCTAVGKIALLDTNSFKIVCEFQAHNDSIMSMTFSADSRLLAVGGRNTICITDIATHPPAAVTTLRGHAGWVRALCFSPDGSLLASWSKDRTLRLWETRSGNPQGVFETDGDDPRFLPDGQTLIIGDTKAVRFLEVRSSDAWVLRGHRGFVQPVLISADGATIYSGGWDGW